MPEADRHDAHAIRDAAEAGSAGTVRDASETTSTGEPRDEVDRIVSAWSHERPDLDFAPLHVLSRVGRLAKHLDRARRDAFVASDLEQWEFDVLSALRRAGGPYELSPKALLQQTLVSSGTMTNRIDRLVARGLVERRTDPNDGRGVRARLTQAGGDAVDAAIERLLAAERRLLADLGPADEQRLGDLLRRLSLTLGD
ncbi:MarR family winged helix-turn-helix transcriptional regulator [Frigoribacterium sp. PvP032]|uniref:MarR family winged helix-turn-helix transcriptional regulator n=1 Tax=Frigoribacterium sp. PvP032 TaxID=2806589 RepID=UPI001AE4F834|nr:MarR family transcriptional regulator [Frigoribacterium sp. PvP032]MBP1191512.1 DNA-binding MarR family transcriptional regulator [Frigoribacterium sp. PvP032]